MIMAAHIVLFILGLYCSCFLSVVIALNLDDRSPIEPIATWLRDCRAPSSHHLMRFHVKPGALEIHVVVLAVATSSGVACWFLVAMTASAVTGRLEPPTWGVRRDRQGSH